VTRIPLTIYVDPADIARYEAAAETLHVISLEPVTDHGEWSKRVNDARLRVDLLANSLVRAVVAAREVSHAAE